MIFPPTSSQTAPGAHLTRHARTMTRRAMNLETAGQRPIGNEEFRSEWQRAAEGVAGLADRLQQWMALC